MPSALAIDAGWIMGALLLSLRLGPALAATPILSPASGPAPVRVAVVLALSAILAQGLPGAPLAGAPARLPLSDVGVLVQAACLELTLGLTLALGIQLAFATFSVAGGLLGVQIGFGLGTAINPTMARQEPLMAALFAQAGVLVFFLVDGHHALLRGLALSLQRFPLGRPWPIEAAAGPLLKLAAGFLGLGFALAAPVVFVVLLIDVALGVVARNLPQVNMLAIGIPVKMVAGLLALALWGGSIGPALTRIYASAFEAWSGLFSAGPFAAGGLHG